MHLPSHKRFEQINDVFEHEACEGKKVETFEGLR